MRRAIPLIIFLVICAYVGWKLVGRFRSIERETYHDADSNSVRYTLMLAFLHWVVGTGASMIIGFLPEGLLSRYYVNTGIEPFAPVIAATGLVLGLAFSGRFRNGQGASWAWIFGMLWLAIGIYELRSGWSRSWSAQRSSWAYAMVNLFGPTSACSDSECLGELLFTMPSTAAVTYSVGAFIRRLLLQRSPLASHS
jgi:hypothetical protein